MNFVVFFWLGGLLISRTFAGQMTQIRYTRDQLIDLRTTGTARSPPTNVIARVNTLFHRRGCRAGRKVKVKLQRRALGVHYSHGDESGYADVSDVDDVQYRPILLRNIT